MKRKESRRDQDDRVLLREIRKIFLESGKRYGRPKLLEGLRNQGYRVGGNRVGKLMQRAGIRSICTKKWKVATTDSKHNMPVSANLIGRNFSAPGPNRVWVSDITYIRTKTGWLYLCVILDLYSRRIVGWSLQPHMKATLVCEALRRALAKRTVEPWKLIFHSDRGSQYASNLVRNLLRENKIISSMSRKGDCYDNAVAESVFGIIKRELVHITELENLVDTRREMFQYIEGFYNRRRIHSYLDYMSPEEFELAGRAA